MEDDLVIQLPQPGAGVADDPLLMVLRSGARRMLQQVIEAEVEAFLAAHAELEDAHGRRRDIAENILSGRRTGAQMAHLYGVSPAMVSRIVNAAQATQPEDENML